MATADADTRPSWDETWMRVADVIAERSRCDRAHVGAVIVTADNRVASSSYNGPPRGMKLESTCSNWCPRARGETDLSPNYDQCPMIHAEENALLRANFTDISGGTIYVSRSSCVGCAKAVANSGLARLVHRVTAQDLHRDPDAVESFLTGVGIEAVRIGQSPGDDRRRTVAVGVVP